MAYRRCEVCGAYLDPAEKCDCGGIAPAVPVPAPARQRREKSGAMPKRCIPPLRKLDVHGMNAAGAERASPTPGRQSQRNSERMPGTGPGIEASGGRAGCLHSAGRAAGAERANPIDRAWLAFDSK